MHPHVNLRSNVAVFTTTWSSKGKIVQRQKKCAKEMGFIQKEETDKGFELIFFNARGFFRSHHAEKNILK